MHYCVETFSLHSYVYSGLYECKCQGEHSCMVCTLPLWEWTKSIDLHKTHICIHIAQDFGYSLSISTVADTRSTLFFGQSVILICTEPSPYLPNLPVLHCQAINLLRICKSRVKHIVHIQLYGPRLVHSSVMGQPYSCTIKRHF